MSLSVHDMMYIVLDEDSISFVRHSWKASIIVESGSLVDGKVEFVVATVSPNRNGTVGAHYSPLNMT